MSNIHDSPGTSPRVAGLCLIGLLIGAGKDLHSQVGDTLLPWPSVITRTLDIWPSRPASDPEFELLLDLLVEDFHSYRTFARARTLLAASQLRAGFPQQITTVPGSAELPEKQLTELADLLSQYPALRLAVRPTLTAAEITSRSASRLPVDRLSSARRLFSSFGVAQQVDWTRDPIIGDPGITLLLQEDEDDIALDLTYNTAEDLLRDARDLARLARRDYRGPEINIQNALRRVLRGAPYNFVILDDRPRYMRTEWLAIEGPTRGVGRFRKQWQRHIMFTVTLSESRPGWFQVDVITEVKVRRSPTASVEVDDLASHQKHLTALLRSIDATLSGRPLQ